MNNNKIENETTDNEDNNIYIEEIINKLNYNDEVKNLPSLLKEMKAKCDIVEEIFSCLKSEKYDHCISKYDYNNILVQLQENNISGEIQIYSNLCDKLIKKIKNQSILTQFNELFIRIYSKIYLNLLF